MPARSGCVSATGTAPAVSGHQVDHAGRQARRLEQAHDEVRGELLGVRRLPHHGVAEQRGRGRQVAGDRGEVERRDREHEALERAVLQPVPAAGDRRGLLGEQAPAKCTLNRQKSISSQAASISAWNGDLDWPRIVDALIMSARPGQQVGGLEQDRGPVVEGSSRQPGRPAAARSRPRRPRRWRYRTAEHVPVVVRLDDDDQLPPPIRCWPPIVIVSSACSPASSLILLSRRPGPAARLVCRTARWPGPARWSRHPWSSSCLAGQPNRYGSSCAAYQSSS